MYTILPVSIRRRLRRIPSLRRSVGTLSRPLSSYSSSGRSTDDTVLGTPPPEYASRLSLSEPGSDNEELGDAVDGLFGPQIGASVFTSAETQSGIRWKFAGHGELNRQLDSRTCLTTSGLTLISLAGKESSTFSTSPASGSPSLIRQLYIHGMTYLLRGLPDNLSPEEKMSVSSAIPDEIAALRAVTLPPTGLAQRDRALSRSIKEPYQSPSILHRILAAVIVQMFLIVHILLPYIKVFMAAAYRYERQHRISERVLSSSISTMDGAMRRGMEISNSVYRMNEGKVGQALNELMAWWIRGVTGGIHQGVGEGLVIIGLDVKAGEGPRKEA